MTGNWEAHSAVSNGRKDFVSNIRTYDEDGFKQRSACICFRDGSEQEVLLVSSSSDPQCWVVPGGGVEPQESPCCAARRELHEEAGAIGAVHRFVGVFTEHEKNEMRKTKTYVFTLKANSLVDKYEDYERIGRQRKWFSLDEARRELRARPASLGYLTQALNSSPNSSQSEHVHGDTCDLHLPCKCGFQKHADRLVNVKVNRSSVSDRNDQQSVSGVR